MNERELNYYFNKGKFNHPKEIGYVMASIRKAKPITINEWEIYYYENVRDEKHLYELAKKMYNFIPQSYRSRTTLEECHDYIKDTIFRRTFEGYSYENIALKYLKNYFPSIKESPKEWDGEYFIDFYIETPLIGIQFKPETFLMENMMKKLI